MNSFAPFPSLDSTSIYLKTEAGFLFDLSALPESAETGDRIKGDDRIHLQCEATRVQCSPSVSSDLILECFPVAAFASLICFRLLEFAHLLEIVSANPASLATGFAGSEPW